MYFAGGCAVVYAVSYLWDRRLMLRTDRLEKIRRVHENELRAMDGDFSAFDTGERFVNPEHEYSFDLDVFGTGSLFNRICRTVTGLGGERLAALLQSTAETESEVRARQEAVREMSCRTDWSMDFLSAEYTESRIREVLLSVKQNDVEGDMFLSSRFVWMWWIPL
ncbi:MAG: hypothetical protein LUD00_04320 [Prevotellaceae bacterium]|nr:hypothetical protein [Prevotellaceae bacterium]